jgi:D-alanine-D-alanine ligase
VIYSHEREHVNFEYIKERLGLPLFIKPASLGSSVGVHKVFNPGELRLQWRMPFSLITRCLLRSSLRAVKFECAVLGNEYPKASVPGEIVTNYDFYSYKAKI